MARIFAGRRQLAVALATSLGGCTLTVLVEATGYYNVIVHSEGEPRREAFRRLLDEPGGVTRFAQERLP